MHLRFLSMPIKHWLSLPSMFVGYLQVRDLCYSDRVQEQRVFSRFINWKREIWKSMPVLIKNSESKLVLLRQALSQWEMSQSSTTKVAFRFSILSTVRRSMMYKPTPKWVIALMVLEEREQSTEHLRSSQEVLTDVFVFGIQGRRHLSFHLSPQRPKPSNLTAGV